MKKLLIAAFTTSILFSNPYWDPSKLQKDAPYESKIHSWETLNPDTLREEGKDVLRVDVKYEDGQFVFDKAFKERSGTEALLKRATKKDKLGSYYGVLINAVNETPLYYDSIGTGTEFKFLTRAITLRFPFIFSLIRFELYGENQETGKMELILKENIVPARLKEAPKSQRLEVKLLKKATVTPALKVNMYAEGYTGQDSTAFFKSAQKATDTLVNTKFPSVDQFEIVGVYAPSNTKLGNHQNLGTPIPERDSFLGLYYAYWAPIERWYDVIYPTREEKFRNAIAQVPYDYPIAIVDDANYWGVGNFNELTAVPANNSYFTYLLTHEFGHYFGLNEEYEGGGKTELAFSPKIDEPWSQNITFHPKKGELKWSKFVSAEITLPTPASVWNGTGPYGAYKGGYADTEPLGHSHKPGFHCTMEDGKKFCPICEAAIKDKVRFDTGG